MQKEEGNRGLTLLHRQISAHVVAGATDADIATSLFVSEATVRRRLAELKEYTKTYSRAGLAAELVRLGFDQAHSPSSLDFQQTCEIGRESPTIDPIWSKR